MIARRGKDKKPRDYKTRYAKSLRRWFGNYSPTPGWANVECEFFKHLLAKGWTLENIGEQLGRSRTAVKAKKERLFLPINPRGPSPYTFEMENLLQEEWTWGLSSGVIAKHLSAMSGRNINRNMVIGKAFRMGLARPVKPAPARIICKRKRKSPPRPGPAPLPATIYISEPVGGRWNLQDNPGCRYPEGDSPDWWFCGAPTVDHSSYCGYHHSVCYRTTRFKQRPPVTPLPGAVGSSACHPPDLAGEPL